MQPPHPNQQPPQRQLRCPVCQGVRITPATTVHAHGGSPSLMYETIDGGFLDQGILLRWIGSACLDCGHVILFLNPQSLALARQQHAWKPIMPT